MASLEKKISKWVEEGLLSDAQADTIIAFEAKEPSRSWVLWGAAGVGIVTLVTGIVSIIAANWGAISPEVKLLVYFIVQAGLGGLFIAVRNRRGPVVESILLANQLLVLAGIGLIAQVYNLSGDGWQALALWLSLVLPLTLLAEYRLAHNIWFLGLTLTVIIWTAGARYDLTPMRTVFALGICVIVFAMGVFKDLRLPRPFTEAALVWSSMFLLVFFTSWADVMWGMRHLHLTNEWSKDLLPGLVFLLISIGLALAAIFRRSDLQANARIALSVMLLLIVAFFVPAMFNYHSEHDLFGCIGFLAIWGSAATASALTGRRRFFNIASFVIALRFIIVYFQVFGSLSATGIGLIISGSVILGITYCWHKLRLRVSRLMVS